MQLNPARAVLGQRVHVPLHLDAVTTVGHEEEGLGPRATAAVWLATQALYRTGLHPGVSLVVRRRGEVVLDRALGHRVWGEPDLMTTDTPTCLYSASKAVTALLLHRLAQEGRLDLDAPVAEALPEFAAHGKAHVTSRDLLTHRAGLAKLPLPKDPDPRLLFDWDHMLALLCAAPLERHSRQAYHAVTGGYVLGEVARRVSGETLPDLIRTRLADPLGLRHLTYGVAPERRGEHAPSYFTGPENLPPLSQAVHRLLGLRAHVIPPAINTDEGLSAIVPAAGIYASAHEACRVFQMLLDDGHAGGTDVLAPATVAEARRPAGPLVIDGNLPVPLRFSAGFMLGERLTSLFGPGTSRAFGHLGFTNILVWADPERELSAALLTTGKAIAPEGVAAMLAVSAALSASVPRR